MSKSFCVSSLASIAWLRRCWRMLEALRVWRIGSPSGCGKLAMCLAGPPTCPQFFKPTITVESPKPTGGGTGEAFVVVVVVVVVTVVDVTPRVIETTSSLSTFFLLTDYGSCLTWYPPPGHDRWQQTFGHVWRRIDFCVKGKRKFDWSWITLNDDRKGQDWHRLTTWFIDIDWHRFVVVVVVYFSKPWFTLLFLIGWYYQKFIFQTSEAIHTLFIVAIFARNSSSKQSSSGWFGWVQSVYFTDLKVN